MTNRTTALAAAMAAMIFSVPALAAEAGTLYLGGSVGQSDADYSSDRCTQDTGFVCETDTKDTAFRITAGYNIVPQLAVEIGYIDLGKVNLNFPNDGVTGDVKSQAFTLEAVGTLPLQDSGLALTGRIGLYSGDTTINAIGPGGSASASQSSSDLTVGIGLAFNFNRNVTGHLEAQRFSGVGAGSGDSGIDINVISLGLSYNFDK